MKRPGTETEKIEIPEFKRQFFDGHERLTRIGGGSVGGKAGNLAYAARLVRDGIGPIAEGPIELDVPSLVVLGTDVFDRFMKQNDLLEMALSGEPDQRIAHAFQQGELPYDVVGDLRALIATVHQPLAVRSSSLLEDAMFRPFAGVYGTKMIPNNQPDADTRFRKLAEAIKFVYASTYFSDARSYVEVAGTDIKQEKMAVIIQEVVGFRHQDRFYPDVSGVARSYSFYPIGRARAEDGVVDLALGLGKTIVDGGACWTYSPKYPNVDPPVTVREQLKQSQTRFWAVNMGRPPAFDPIQETEYLVHCDLTAAEADGTLSRVASTYSAERDRIVIGTGSSGPRLVNFAPIIRLDDIPLNRLIRELLVRLEEKLEVKVEMEFAMTIDSLQKDRVRFGLLQVRPMVVSHEEVDVDESDLGADDALIASDRVMGNGSVDNIRDIVFVKPAGFDARNTPLIAAELEGFNRSLAGARVPYLLIGFGRWGSSDPWLGIPVNWGQIGGAKVIVEATLPEMNVELSQGSHFFHNISSFQVCYFCARHDGDYPIRWDRLEEFPVVSETEYIRHVRVTQPMLIRVDGRHSRGVVRV